MSSGGDDGVMAASGISLRTGSADAVREAFERAREQVTSSKIDLAFIFVSPHHAEGLEEAAAAVASSVGGATLLGCTTEAPIGESREAEGEAAVSVWLASLGDVRLQTFRADLQSTPDGQAIVGFPLLADRVSATLLLTDPFSFPTNALLSSLNGDHPGLPVIGGAASGGRAPSENKLVLDGEVFSQGAVGAILGEQVAVRPLLSQGCKPIGDPFVVTAAEDNTILELGGLPPLHRLREVVSRLDADDQSLVTTGLQIGVLIDEHTQEPGPGDFLIRGIVHANLRTGAIACNDFISVGQTMQFQLRDATAAHHDLERTLTAIDPAQLAGALLFTCNGRGSRMFGSRHHDVECLEAVFDKGSVAGMFCQGEIGPVGGRNFLHGFTASIAAFSRS